MDERKITTYDVDSVIVPPDGGTHLPVSRKDIEIFNDILGEELDSSFSSSICCCDYCFDEFSSLWPGVVSRKSEFQTCSIPVDWYLNSSRIRDIYSEAEFQTLRNFVTCTRCKSEGPANVWIYEHDFNHSADQDSIIRQASEIALKTPFLLLEDDFAKQVRSELKRVAKDTTPSTLDYAVFRGRDMQDVITSKQDPLSPTTYGAPPAAVVTEGRFNHAGHPMIYFSMSLRGASKEIGKPGGSYFIAEMQLPPTPIRVLDLDQPLDSANDSDVLAAASQSLLVAAPASSSGWLRPEYGFSRFIADCALESGFDAIKFGSTKDNESCNIVILNPAIFSPSEFKIIKVHYHHEH
ncbi:RES family NAD+ phosphorylase [Stenotrophomonas geniculata]|uniref:RES family NAD+ phosphorylase n=1 Tax=Stenotrophomonas geniculata TaxID=86188 RepID=UPI0013130299|nr:RES family NAD+ phosphorylase [Stenotrophomonas geniculata]